MHRKDAVSKRFFLTGIRQRNRHTWPFGHSRVSSPGKKIPNKQTFFLIDHSSGTTTRHSLRHEEPEILKPPDLINDTIPFPNPSQHEVRRR